MQKQIPVDAGKKEFGFGTKKSFLKAPSDDGLLDKIEQQIAKNKKTTVEYVEVRNGLKECGC